MGELSIWHLLLVAGIILVFFGPSRLPGLGKSLGQAIRGFKQGMNEIDVESKDVSEIKEPETKKTESLEAAQAKANQAEKTKSGNKLS